MKLIKFFGVASIVAMMFATLSVTGVRAAVNDFEITNYDMALELGRDDAQRSTLTTTETITANFPMIDQNHGIERAIPTSYEGHSTGLEIISVTDQNGTALTFSTDRSNGTEVLRVGDKDTYVQGSKTYVLKYKQHDVTRYYADTNKDEFYWDLNGTQWKVPIRQFTAAITLTPELARAYSQSNCYEGAQGATGSCSLTQEGEVFRVAATELPAGENVTIAFGFSPQTFAQYQASFWERLVPIWLGVMLVSGIIGLGVVVWAIVRYSKQSNRTHEMGTVVPEYLPPKEQSVTTAAEVIDSPRAVLAAQLIDFAVRHYIKIYETKEKSLWSTAEYTLEIVRDIATLKEEEQELLRDLYDGQVAVGTKLEMKKLQNSTALYGRMQDNPGKLKKLVRGAYALRTQIPRETSWFNRVALVLMILGIVSFSPVLLIYALIIWIMGTTLWPLTDKGLTLRRYLEGLKLYIGVAEVERIKMLQSPDGAEKVGKVSESDSGELVKLYEKVLPYAILFGQEKEWGARLGDYYESAGGSPSWYGGANTTAFNAAVLTSAIGNFSTAAAYTSASSSSTGGSGGGGSSGGGGGGGGGGGW